MTIEQIPQADDKWAFLQRISLDTDVEENKSSLSWSPTLSPVSLHWVSIKAQSPIQTASEEIAGHPEVVGSHGKTVSWIYKTGENPRLELALIFSFQHRRRIRGAVLSGCCV